MTGQAVAGQMAREQGRRAEARPDRAMTGQAMAGQMAREQGRRAEAGPGQGLREPGHGMPGESSRIHVAPGQMRPGRMPGVTNAGATEAAEAKVEAPAPEPTVTQAAIVGRAAAEVGPSAAVDGIESLPGPEVPAQRPSAADEAPGGVPQATPVTRAP